MTKDVREQIARELIITRLCNQPPIHNCKDMSHYSHKTTSPICKECLADQILSLLKENGYEKPVSVEMSDKVFDTIARTKGYVRLAETKKTALELGIERANNEAVCANETYIRMDSVSKYSPVFQCKQGRHETISCDNNCPDFRKKVVE